MEICAERVDRRASPPAHSHRTQRHFFDVAEKKQKGGLSLDTREAVLKGGDTGPARVAGEQEKSLLIEAARRTNHDIDTGKLPGPYSAFILPRPAPTKSSIAGPAVLSDRLRVRTIRAWLSPGTPTMRFGARFASRIS